MKVDLMAKLVTYKEYLDALLAKKNPTKKGSAKNSGNISEEEEEEGVYEIDNEISRDDENEGNNDPTSDDEQSDLKQYLRDFGLKLDPPTKEDLSSLNGLLAFMVLAASSSSLSPK